jgi:hypothetical protein
MNRGVTRRTMRRSEHRSSDRLTQLRHVRIKP